MSSHLAGRIERIASVCARDHVLIAAYHGRVAHMEETPDKVAALLAAAQALASIQAPYALIGGVAVGIHSGTARATEDTDLAVHSSVGRPKVREALAAAGFTFRGEFRHSDNFRHHSGEPVQIVTDVSFDPMIERATRFDVAGQSIPIVTRSDLIEMKLRAAGDPACRRSKALRDQADVELLRGDVPDPDEGW
jgi:hypothetical protein